MRDDLCGSIYDYFQTEEVMEGRCIPGICSGEIEERKTIQ